MQAQLLAVIVCPSVLAAQPGGSIDVGDRKQLFIDNRFIAESQGVTLRMNSPAKQGPVILPDKPWESCDIGFCVSVFEQEGLYKMWYMARSTMANEGTVYCYATSTDGVHWEKPSLGLYEFQGSTDNNIVLTGTIETTVFLDPVAPDGARFKAVAVMHWPDPERAGIYIHTSADGIHWRMSDERVFPLSPDTANQAFYDTRLGKYVANIRLWNPMRKVGRIEMDDITGPWPFTPAEKPYYVWGADKIPVPSVEVETAFSYDEQDPVPSDHYNAACVQYPWAQDAYFMFPSAYRHFPDPPVGKHFNDGLLDIQLAVSRDGRNWTRLSREPYIPLGLDGEIDSRQLYMAVGMLRVGGYIHQYYGGYNMTHGEFEGIENAGSLCLARQRLDGFVSADTAYTGGELTTPPLSFSGSRLLLNIDCGAMGTCKVELLDDAGEPIPGFTAAECDEIGVNSVAKVVTWKGSSDVSALRGRAVRLRFVMRATKLFAFQFEE